MILKIKLHPGAKNNVFGETLADGTIKISLTTPPIEGRANQALIEFLSRHFRAAKNQIKIVKGLRSKNKVVEIK